MKTGELSHGAGTARAPVLDGGSGAAQPQFLLELAIDNDACLNGQRRRRTGHLVRKTRERRKAYHAIELSPAVRLRRNIRKRRKGCIQDIHTPFAPLINRREQASVYFSVRLNANGERGGPPGENGRVLRLIGYRKYGGRRVSYADQTTVDIGGVTVRGEINRRCRRRHRILVTHRQIVAATKFIELSLNVVARASHERNASGKRGSATRVLPRARNSLLQISAPA